MSGEADFSKCLVTANPTNNMSPLKVAHFRRPWGPAESISSTTDTSRTLEVTNGRGWVASAWLRLESSAPWEGPARRGPGPRMDPEAHRSSPDRISQSGWIQTTSALIRWSQDLRRRRRRRSSGFTMSQAASSDTIFRDKLNKQPH